MSIELVRNLINYENMIGEGTGQAMVNGDIILGERSQEIMSILHMDGKAVITGAECYEDKVSLEGRMTFELLYSTNDSRHGVNKVNAVSNFSHDLQVPGAKHAMLCKSDLRIEHIDFEQINNRKIKVNAIINLLGKVYEKTAAEAVVDIKAQDIQVLRSNVSIDEFVAENKTQSIVKNLIELEEQEAPVNTVLKREIDIVRKNAHIGDGRVTINAAAQIRLMFDDENDNLCVREQEVPFNCELMIPGIKENMKCDVAFQVEEAYDEIREDENGNRKIIETELVVECKGKAYTRREIENVIDAYAPGRRYEMEKEILRPLSFYGEGSGTENLNEKVELPLDAGPLRKLLSCIAKPIVTELKPLENKVMVEGLVNCCFIYEKEVKVENPELDDTGCLASHEEELPFKSVIDINGVKIEMLPEVDVMLNGIGFEQLHGNEVAVRMAVSTNAKVYNRVTADLSIGAFEAELPANIASMPPLVIYSVQQNDSLWKIAKKFNTIIEDIVELNELENPDVLQVGRKLLIPRKAFMK